MLRSSSRIRRRSCPFFEESAILADFAAAWQDLGGWPLPPGGLLGLMARLGGFFHS